MRALRVLLYAGRLAEIRKRLVEYRAFERSHRGPHGWTDIYARRVSPDPAQFVLGLPSDGRPPNSWSYNDAAVSLLTPILERAQGMPLEDLAKRDLFAPLGIERFSWGRDKAGHAMAYMGLKMRTRDLVKLAWLMADAGKWNGSTVLPAEWVTDSSRAHVSGAWRNPPIVDTGYGWPSGCQDTSNGNFPPEARLPLAPAAG